MADARAVAGAALVTALAVAAAGCGGGSSTPVAATTTAATGTVPGGAARTAAFQAFAACLREHGVTLPNGGFLGRRPGGTPPGTGAAPTTTTPRQFRRPSRTPAQQKAFDACRSKLPAGGFFGRRGGGAPNGGGPSQNPAFARYTQCLKAHGVTFGQSASPSAFRKAQQACAKYRPSFGGATTTTGSA